MLSPLKTSETAYIWFVSFFSSYYFIPPEQYVSANYPGKYLPFQKQK